MPNFSLSATLGLNSAAFQTGMAAATTSTTGLRTSLAGLSGPLASIGFVAAARRAVNLGSKISDLAVQLNIGTTELQVLMRATQEAGVGQNTLARALRNVQIRTEEAINGNTSYGEAFERLGINIEEFSNLSTDEKFLAIAQAQSDAKDSGQAYNDVARILGERAGPELQEVLQTLARDGWGAVERSAQEAGQIMSEDVARDMDEAADSIEDLSTRFTILMAQALSPLIDVLTLVSEGWGIIKDSIVAAGEQAGNLGSLLGEMIGSVFVPLATQLEGLGAGFTGLGQAITGDFDSAGDSFTQMRNLIETGFDTLQDAPATWARAWEDYNTETNRTNDEWEDKAIARVDNIDGAMNGLFESIGLGANNATDELSGIDEGAKDAANGANPSLRGIKSAVFSIGDQARLTKEEIEKLNDIRIDGLSSELQGVEGNITSLSDEISSTKQRILDLNSSNLDELLATFGVTAEQLGDEMENQIAGAGRDGADLSAEELERSYERAIANIRQEMREELGDNTDFSNVMPNESEMQSIIGLMGTVADQSSALAQAPDTVSSLTEELGQMNAELVTLEESRQELQTEIEGLDGSMQSASTAIGDQAQAIENIEIPETLGELIDGELDGIDFSEVTSEIRETNSKLDEINTTLSGMFVNQ